MKQYQPKDKIELRTKGMFDFLLTFWFRKPFFKNNYMLLNYLSPKMYLGFENYFQNML